MSETTIDSIQTYFSSILEVVEQRLTKLSLHNELSPSLVSSIQNEYKEIVLGNHTLTSDELYYLDNYLDEWFSKRVTPIRKLHSRREQIHTNMIELKQLQLPEQRSPEWYKIRENLLTASSLADALGKGHFQTRDGLLLSKTADTKKEISKASQDIMQWGVKYEPVATRYYEHLYGVSIVEFGLIPHPKLSVFGASPDGICDIGSPNGYEGRMLEIKCPPKRKFTHEVPRHYWMQMQGQLEVCDLDECDFFQVKLEEYSDVTEYEEDCLLSEGIQHGLTRKGYPKGLLIAYKEKGSIEYRYSPWLASLDTLLNWKREVLSNLREDQLLHEIKWWYVERYECTLVRRDTEWWNSVTPGIIQFWSDVVHYRKVGNEEVQKRINSRKRGPRKQTFTVQAPIKGYLLDSDED